MKRIFFLSLGYIFLSLNGIAQDKITVSGIAYGEYNEPLAFANVEVYTHYANVQTDAYGRYAVRVNKTVDEYGISCSYIGYETSSLIFETQQDTIINFYLKPSSTILETIKVSALSVKDEAPFTYSNLSKETIQKNNLGQDIPYLLNNTPSVVVTSDAGAGIGYTGIRVRGSDATRTNVVINDIPLNDSESQGTFWVNLPDLASSTQSIQIQRGVGASTNGAGAFGATVNLQTKGYNIKRSVGLSTTYGSFNTQKYTLNLSSGLLKNKLAFDARLSQITTDGYIDRASSNLKGAYLSGGFFGDKTSLQAIVMLGKEITYQSWYGSPEAKVEGDEDGLLAHYNNNIGVLYNTAADSINLFSSDRRYNYYLYDDQVDDYQQNHYQLHLNHKLSQAMDLKVALHYTQGEGFFEEFKFQDSFADYGFQNPMVNGEEQANADLVRRRWLDNDFYGTVFNINYKPNTKSEYVLGGAVNRYEGDHFGRLVSSSLGELDFLRENYYFGASTKDDANIYLKSNHKIRIGENKNIYTYLDLQYRGIFYQTKGTDNDLVQYDIDETFHFFNPKAGLSYQMNKESLLYASVGIANKEPARSDFIDAISRPELSDVPVHETLINGELGFRKTSAKLRVETNLYYMKYDNQLIPTGELNDVGSTLRKNVEDSYRAGVELSIITQLTDWFDVGGNATLSRNKIKEFNEVLYDYTNGFEVIINNYEDTDIAFSPNIIVGSQIIFRPLENLELGLYPKYVGKQFLDNTSNDARSLDAYMVTDFLGIYQIPGEKWRQFSISLKVNNVFNTLYSANGYTYSYVFGDLITENFLYPQAGANFLAGLSIKF